MSHDRYPEDLVLTTDDFANCGWKEVLAGAEREGYFSMYSVFSDAEKKAFDEDRKAHGKVLWLLSGACSMMLSPESVNEPFKPYAVFNGRRSTIPDDLSESDVAFFTQIIDKIDDPWLKARLADLVWLVKNPREVKFAIVAIDSYRSIPFDTETWGQDVLNCWQRAIHLACLIGKGAGNRLAEMEASIIETFKSTMRPDGFLCLQLANLLKSNGLGKDQALMIAKKLETFAPEFEGERGPHSTGEYFQAAADWFKKSGDDAKSIEMTVAQAENWVKTAIYRITSTQPSHMVAAKFYEKAIQIYRTVPRAMRSEYCVDERIADLQKRLNESEKKSLDEMRVISTPLTDISELVKNVRDAVKGKTLLEALRTFANLPCSINCKELRESAVDQIQNFPLQTLVATRMISTDGRTVAQHSGINPNTESSDDDKTGENEKVIRSTMIRNYQQAHIGIAVQGYIWPALEILLLEHRIRETDFIALASQSPIVPIGREQLFGKALFAGYDRDFVTALHILVPQVEHMVRFHLQQAQVKTRNLDSSGVVTENSLNTLMDLSETKEIFGENLCFEIKALFCDPFGPNLRNELAHGLLDANSCQSSYAIYAWWLVMKLVFNTFWNHSRNNADIE